MGTNDFEGSDGGPLPNTENWAPTISLRFVRRAEGPTMKNILQQMWQGSQGNVRWEDVPVVHEQ